MSCLKSLSKGEFNHLTILLTLILLEKKGRSHARGDS